MSDEETTINVKGLEQLLKALKAAPPVARVGVLGSKTIRQGSLKTGVDNATVGAAHEFGTPRLPIRSFLRIPISDLLDKEMDSSGLLNEDVTKEVLKEGSVIPWLKKVAIISERIVLGAFDTGGYGKWPPWKDKNYTNNANQLLVDTAQLRNSITSEVR